MSLHFTNALGDGLRVVVVLKVHFYRFVSVLCDYVFDVNFRTYVTMCMDYCNWAYSLPQVRPIFQEIDPWQGMQSLYAQHIPSTYAEHICSAYVEGIC
jgi:hypothetical protein